jgi:hypothetical protein
MAQWYEPDYWISVQAQVDQIDALIGKYNTKVGLI